MGLTVVLLPAPSHRYLAAALAALRHQTAPHDAYRVCVVDGPGWVLRTEGPRPVLAVVPRDELVAWLKADGDDPVLLLRSDVAVFADAVARSLSDGPGARGARVARVRQTADPVESAFHQYVNWHTARPAPEPWPRWRWFDGLLFGGNHRAAAAEALSTARPPAVTLLEVECRLHSAGTTVGAAVGWIGHMIEPVSQESWYLEAQAAGRHVWDLATAWPESVLATDLGLATAIAAAAEDGAPGHVAEPSDVEDGPAADSLLEWRDRMSAWHAGLYRAVAAGVREASAARPAHVIGGSLPLKDAGGSGQGRLVGHGTAVEGDSHLLPLESDGVAGFRLLRAPSGGYHAYFVVQNAPRARRGPLDVVVEYLDRGHAVWGLDYDSTDRSIVHAPEPPGAFKRAEGLVEQGDTGRWRTARFTLPDWRFHRRCHGADLRLIGLERMDDGIVVGRVTVEAPERTTLPSVRVAGDLERPVQVPGTTEPSVSIVVPAHDALAYTRQCLHAITRTVGIPYELIVVDNASNDGTRDYVAACPGVRLVRRDRNDSFAASCNDGARLARAPLLVFLNNDTVPLGGWLTALTWPLLNGLAGVSGGRLLFPDDWSIQHAGIEWADARAWHVMSRRPAECVEAATPRAVFAVTGACLAIGQGVFWDVGGFDERFVFGYEDVDLCMKVGELGLVTMYCPQSTVLHYQGASGRDEGLDHGNRARFIQRWPALAALREEY